MRPYRAVDHESGVVAYELQPQAILVEFRNGSRYRYTYESTGADQVERMKRLAASGTGLATFISQEIRTAYAQRLR